jgi:4'-phosphopantetheinyl transferase
MSLGKKKSGRSGRINIVEFASETSRQCNMRKIGTGMRKMGAGVPYCIHNHDLLPLREVHIWPLQLIASAEDCTRYLASFADDERTRAASFSLPHLQERFVAGRGALRCILASYLGCTPAEVKLSYTPYGKPFLCDEAEHGLRFNLSHSEDQALLAVTRGRTIGVDIERIRPDFATDEIAKRFFSEREWQELRGLPAAERTTAFFRCWTRKEAFIKAVGEGLSFPLDAFAVSLAPREPAALCWLRGLRADDDGVRRWHLRDAAAPAGFLAALAVDGDVSRVVIQSSAYHGGVNSSAPKR